VARPALLLTYSSDLDSGLVVRYRVSSLANFNVPNGRSPLAE